MYKDLYKASYAYFTLEFASLLLAIILLEKVLLKIFNLYSGSRLMINTIALGMVITHISATIFWFAYTKSGNHCETALNQDRPDICYSTGAKIAISNIVFMFITVVAIFSLFKYYDWSEVQEKSLLNYNFLWISSRIWGWLIFVFCLISILLMLASLSTSSWVNNSKFYGGLYRCNNCDTTTNLGWDCLQGTACSINSSSEECNNYKELYKAAQLFISFESAAIIFFMLFLQVLINFNMGNDYGSSSINYVSFI